jgi:hypothetical protein
MAQRNWERILGALFGGISDVMPMYLQYMMQEKADAEQREAEKAAELERAAEEANLADLLAEITTAGLPSVSREEKIAGEGDPLAGLVSGWLKEYGAGEMDPGQLLQGLGVAEGAGLSLFEEPEPEIEELSPMDRLDLSVAFNQMLTNEEVGPRGEPLSAEEQATAMQYLEGQPEEIQGQIINDLMEAYVGGTMAPPPVPPELRSGASPLLSVDYNPETGQYEATPIYTPPSEPTGLGRSISTSSPGWISEEGVVTENPYFQPDENLVNISELAPTDRLGGIPAYYAGESDPSFLVDASGLNMINPDLKEAIDGTLETLRAQYGFIATTNLGAYNNREMRGRPGIISQHATGDALDLRGFVMPDGGVVSYDDYGNYPEGSMERDLLDTVWETFRQAGFNMAHPPGTEKHIHIGTSGAMNPPERATETVYDISAAELEDMWISAPDSEAAVALNAVGGIAYYETGEMRQRSAWQPPTQGWDAAYRELARRREAAAAENVPEEIEYSGHAMTPSENPGAERIQYLTNMLLEQNQETGTPFLELLDNALALGVISQPEYDFLLRLI